MIKFDNYLHIYDNIDKRTKESKLYAHQDGYYGVTISTAKGEDKASVLSDMWFDVEELELFQKNYNQYIATVSLQWHGQIKEYAQYEVAFDRGKLYWQYIKEEFSNHNSISTTKFLNLQQNYLKKCIKDEIAEFEKHTPIGWSRNEGTLEYMGVTDFETGFQNLHLLLPFEYCREELYNKKLTQKDILTLIQILEDKNLFGIFESMKVFL